LEESGKKRRGFSLINLAKQEKIKVKIIHNQWLIDLERQESPVKLASALAHKLPASCGETGSRDVLPCCKEQSVKGRRFPDMVRNGEAKKLG
jgi:hypothetical protein